MDAEPRQQTAGAGKFSTIRETMKGMANRQKRIVRAQENIQKRLLELQKMKRDKTRKSRPRRSVR